MNLWLVAQDVSTTSQAILDAALVRGHTALAIKPLECPLLFSNQGIRVSSQHALPDLVCTRLTSEAPEYTHHSIRQLELLGVRCINSAAALERVHHKARMQHELMTHAIAAPRSLFFAPEQADSEQPIAAITAAVGDPPWILKLPKGRHGTGVMLVDSERSLRSLLDGFRVLNQPLLIQEFVRSAQGVGYRALVVGGQTVAVARRQASGDEFRSNHHLGSTVEAIQPEPQLCALAERVAAALQLEIAGVDLIAGPDGYLVLEANSAPGFAAMQAEHQSGAGVTELATRVFDYLETCWPITIGL